MVSQSSAVLGGLNAMLREEPGVLAALGRASTVLVVPEPARAVTLAGLLAASRRTPMVVAVPTAADAERLSADLRNFLPRDAVELFPAWETLPFERVSPSIETMGLRLRTLWRLRTADPSLSVIVAPARALVQRLLRIRLRLRRVQPQHSKARPGGQVTAVARPHRRWPACR